MNKPRQIKLQPKFHDLASQNRPIVVPELRMSGKWLAAAGFAAGEHVIIEVSENRLIITKRA